MDNNNPVEIFRCWWQQALADSPLKQKSAVCLSTLDADGFPAGRFVDLKQVDEDGFTFCTATDSAKGNDIARDNKVSLTIWWDHIGYQVRIIGAAVKASEQEADNFWHSRSKAAQTTSLAFTQSQTLSATEELQTRFAEVSDRMANVETIPRPENWSAYKVLPVAIEFLTFEESRLHLRKKFRKLAGHWQIE